MDPDPSSLLSIFFLQPPFTFSLFNVIVALLFIVAAFALFWTSLIERYLVHADAELFEELLQKFYNSYDKLSLLYQKSNRFSTVFLISKLVLAVFIVVSIYFIAPINANLFILAGINLFVLGFLTWTLPLLLFRYKEKYMRIGITVSYPLLRTCLPLANMMISKAEVLDKEEISIEEIKTVLPSSQEEKPSIANLSLYKQILRFDKIKVRHVMRPKRELEGIKSNYNFKEVLTKIQSTSYSRLPVYEGNWSKVQGIIHCKDLLPYTKKNQLDWKKKIRPIIYVQEQDNAQSVLRTFQTTKNHMALVLSSSKRLVGLVTLEDITEEIIGEIEDE